MKANNSARCLHEILKTAMNCPNPDVTIAHALAPALKVDNPDLEKYKYGDFFRLIREVEEDVSTLKNIDELEDYLSAIQEVSGIFLSVRMFQDSWSSIYPLIQQSRSLTNINSCALFLEQRDKYPTLEKEALEGYLQDCQAMIEDVLSSDLEDDIKIFLVIKLRDICTAIENYHLGGTKKSKRVIEENLGGLLLRSYGLALEEKNKPIYSRLFTYFLTFGGVLDTAANVQGYLVPKITEVVQLLLSSH